MNHVNFAPNLSVLSGRYTKNNRHFPQKQKPCPNCSGKGCRVCNFHGISDFESVEGVISELLFKKIGATTANLLGLVVKTNLALFWAQGDLFLLNFKILKNEKFRSLSKKNNSISIMNLKIEKKITFTTNKFSSKIDIGISTDSKISSITSKK